MLNDQKFLEWAQPVTQNIRRLWTVFLWTLLLVLVEAGAIVWLIVRGQR